MRFSDDFLKPVRSVTKVMVLAGVAISPSAGTAVALAGVGVAAAFAEQAVYATPIVNPFVNSQLEGGSELISSSVAGSEVSPAAVRVNVNTALQNLIDGDLVVDQNDIGDWALRVIFAHAEDVGNLPDQARISFFSDSASHLSGGIGVSDSGLSFGNSVIQLLEEDVARSAQGGAINISAISITDELIGGGVFGGSPFSTILDTFINSNGRPTAVVTSNDGFNPFNLIASVDLVIDGDIGQGVQTFFESGNAFSTDSGNLAFSLALVSVPEPTQALTILGGVAFLSGKRRRGM